MTMPASVKEEAHKVIDRLPDEADWQDVAYTFFIRERVERGLAEAAREYDLMEHEEFFDKLEEEGSL
jgi:hypothetical protein